MNGNKFNKEYWEEKDFEDKYYIEALVLTEWLEPLNILDYGCGRGYFTHAFRHYDIPCVGYDISQWAVENAYEKSKGHLYTSIPEGKFDVVFVYDVLEHIPMKVIDAVLDKIIEKAQRYVFASICFPEYREVYKDPTHVTIRTRDWWKRQFERRGMEEIEVPNKFMYYGQYVCFKKKEGVKEDEE